ncbi:MAG TPA: Hsp20/alpha crystallin family protein, partial [Vicinamibacterales bacterium]
SDLPARTTNARSTFQVDANDDQWRIDVPLPGVDPKNVALEVAGNTLTIRAVEPKTERRQELRYEQTLTIPPFLDLEKIGAAHRHGMLELTVPIKEAIKPRRIQITGAGEDRKQLQSEQREMAHK